jgi:hypothetical protein
MVTIQSPKITKKEGGALGSLEPANLGFSCFFNHENHEQVQQLLLAITLSLNEIS